MSTSTSIGVEAERGSVDVVVVGGGAAGLSAAKILARSRRSVLVVDAGAPRNAPAEGVHNYLYAEGTPPGKLVGIGRAEAQGYGVEVVEATATAATVVASPEPGGSRFTLDLATGNGETRTVGARRLVLATGVLDVLPDVEGLAARWGRDVLHCPFCHGWEVRDQAIGVLGTNPMALHQVLMFRQLSGDVVYFQHTAPDPTDPQVEQLAALGVDWVIGEVAAIETTGDVLSGVRMVDGRVVARQAVAVATGLEARQDLLADLGLATAELKLGETVAGHYLPTDPAGLTATPGVWAAGNVTTPMAQVITSAAAGSGVGAAIHLDLINEDTDLAVTALRAQRAPTVREVFSAAMEAKNSEHVLGDRRHGLVVP
jgi:thioredoxin reductase